MKAFNPQLLALSVGIVICSPTIAQQSSRTEETLVEGRPVDEKISEIAIDIAKFGSQVQVISSEEIETGGFTNFGELAAGLIRGANIGYSPDEGEFTIRIDGGTDRDTLLLLDGVPTFDRGTPLESLWGATAIDPRMIDSVEIFRGGQSLYYGGNGGLGVVNVLYKKPEAGSEINGEIGFYAGSFDTRELYGNVSTPIGDLKQHYVMFFGRSYETTAHEIFSEDAYTDNVLELGGKHDFPYSYNLAGAKYLWAPNDVTELRLSYQYATIDFRDSFPNVTIFQPNYTEFPIFDAKFKTRFSDSLSYEFEAYYTAPILYNSEVDARICNLPRMQDLPEEIQAIAAGQGITEFSNATEFEDFANDIDGLPAGCVTNPYNTRGGAAISSTSGFYVDENGTPYGTHDNPFPIGAPMGYVIQSSASFGSGDPTKGFGQPNQFRAGYIDYGINNRLKMEWNRHLETVIGAQNITYKDNSADEYGMKDDAVSSTGIYGDLRISADFLRGTNISIAGRQDFNNEFEDQFIWKFGLRQEMPKGLYLRASGGTSYSNPTLSEAGMRSNLVTNPDLETQEVETFGLGFGINGTTIGGGTYNVELGYFDTTIDKLFGSDQIEDVCINFADSPDDLNPNVITPTSFCEFAERESLQGTDTAYFNLNQQQDIEGITLDIAFDFEKFQADFTFTDMESLEPNPIYGENARRAGTGEVLDFVVPGAAGNNEFRQSSERPEWSASALFTYTPTEQWVISLNPTWQGPEWAYGNGTSSRLVDENGERTNPDLNFGDYFVLNGSVQYFLGDRLQHRFLLRAVNLLDEDYYERASASADQRVSRAFIRGEMSTVDSEYYYQYGWNGKPRSFWLQYEYEF